MSKKGSRSEGSNAVGGYQFINLALSEVDKERLDSLDIDTEFPFTGIGALVSSGYKVSFSYDDRNQSAICSLTDNRPQSAFFKHILTGRGATAAHAWASLCYKHFYVAQEQWENIAKVDIHKSLWG